MRFIRKVAEQTDGMMSVEAYECLHRLARQLDDGDVLDIGVGQEATTIAYAHGLEKGGHAGKVIAVTSSSRTGPHGHIAIPWRPTPATPWSGTSRCSESTCAASG